MNNHPAPPRHLSMRRGQSFSPFASCAAFLPLLYILFLLSAALCLSSALAAPGAQAQERKSQAEDIETVRVGLYENSPKIFTNEQGDAAGFWPDIVRAIAGKEGWTVKWVPGTWSQGLERLGDNRIDIMPDTGWTEPRSERFAFNRETVLLSWSRLYVREGEGIESILELEGKSIGALAGSFNLEGPDGIQEFVHEFEIDCTFIGMDSYDEVFQALEAGRIDAAVTNKDFGNRHEDLYAVERAPVVFQPARMQFAFAKNAPATPYLIKHIDARLEELKQDSRSVYYESLDLWLGMPASTDGIPTWGKWLGLGAGGLCIVLFLGNVILRAKVQSRTRSLQQEIEARKLKEEALRQSEERYRTILESIEDGYFEVDLAGNLTFFNTSLCSILGYPPEELQGLNNMQFMDEANARTVFQTFNAVYHTGEPDKAFDWELIRKDGTKRVVETSVSLRHDAQGKAVGFQGIARDVTERKQAEASLRAAKLEAEAANRTKSEFLANMSHEIRTPLNGVMGMLQLLQSTELDKEQGEYVDIATRSTQRLTRLLSDILDLSKVEANRVELREEFFRLTEVMQSIEDLFTHTLLEQETRLDLRIDERIPEILVGDSTRLTQILFNLVGNASKFTRQGSVEVEASLLPAAREEVCRILFMVQDSGEGIPEEKLDRIFEPFTQAEEAPSPYARQREGAGLGLPLVKRLVSLMNGSLSILSKENVGTTVYVSLSFKLMPPSQSSDSRRETDGKAGGKGARLLLADDDEATRLHVVRLLEKRGYAVHAVTNGEEALQALAEDRFDGVLLDVQMPVLDGAETAMQIRASQAGFRNIPLIALTAYAMSGDKERFLQAGMDDYIAKPVDREELLRVLERNLSQGRS